MLNTFKLSLVGILFSVIALAQAPSEKQDQYNRFKTRIINGGFENGTSNWSASGGTLSANTTLSNVRSGLRSGSWDATAASQTLTSSANTMSAGSNQVSCWFKTTATDYTFGVYDGSNVIVSQGIPATSDFQKITLNYAMSAAGQLRARITSASNAAVLYVDDCFAGEADNAGNGNFATDAIALSSMSTDAFGTTSGLSAYYERSGDRIIVWGHFTAGTTAASTAALILPNNLQIDYGKISTATNNQPVGYIINEKTGANSAISSGDLNPILFADGSDTTRLFVAYQVGSAQIQKVNGSTLFASGHVIAFKYDIPVKGWAAQSMFDANVAPAYWSGYHSSDCTWSSTSTTYADVSAGDASCTFTEVVNNNFGTVSSYTISSNNAPGIVFSPTRSGVYEVCADVSGFGPATAILRQGYRLTDGTNTIGQVEFQTETTAQVTETHKVCGYVNASSLSSKTYRLHILTGSGTISLGAPSGSSLSAVYWTIKQLSAVATAPLLTGNVTSNSSGSLRVEHAFVTASTAVVSRSSSNWLSVSRSSAGIYTLTFTTGTWSSAPVCTSTIESSTGMGFWRFNNTMTATSVGVSISNTADAANVDRDFDIICIGPK